MLNDGLYNGNRIISEEYLKEMLSPHLKLGERFVILNYVEPDKDIVEFHTLSGKLTVKKKDNLYEMDFHTYEQKEISVTDEMESAFGVRPVKAVLGPDLLCIFDAGSIGRDHNVLCTSDGLFCEWHIGF